MALVAQLVHRSKLMAFVPPSLPKVTEVKDPNNANQFELIE